MVIVMDFARKQLEKYGWTEGKGLGKHEDGISQALKPKIKRSVTGVGHDPAADFNEHWWSALYDKAAKNVEVEEKNGKTKKIKTIEPDEFQITNSTWKINKKQLKNNNEQYSDNFVRTSVMSGGNKTEVVRSESESEGEGKVVVQMTDEELFKACEGRTAHKGARHGLKATGKLARIQQQEQMLLTLPKYDGYSHAKKIKQKDQDTETVVEEITFDSEEVKERKKKKKKKRCSFEVAQEMQPLPKILRIDDENNKNMAIDGDASDKITDNLVENCDEVRKSKKKKRMAEDEVVENELLLEEIAVKKKKKKKKSKEGKID